jgi:hypothetical protein
MLYAGGTVAMTNCIIWGHTLALAVRGGINFLLWPVIDNLVCFLVALAVSGARAARTVR